MDTLAKGFNVDLPRMPDINIQIAQGEYLDRHAQMIGVERRPYEADSELRFRVESAIRGPMTPTVYVESIEHSVDFNKYDTRNIRARVRVGYDTLGIMIPVDRYLMDRQDIIIEELLRMIEREVYHRYRAPIDREEITRQLQRFIH